jgi:hypothetical protein
MTVRFKDESPALAAEFLQVLHPDARRVVLELAAWSRKRGLPDPVVTCVVRDPSSNAAVGGVPNSWHLAGCAVDLRDKHYSPDERADVVSWLERRCTIGPFELVTHTHGNATHLHLARRDFSWRKKEKS